MLILKHDKNEGVFLWLLEQERQKDRTHQLNERLCNIAMQSSNTLPEELFCDEKFQEENDVQLEPEPDELNNLNLLLKEKANLEEESCSLNEQEERLNLQIKMLLEKIVAEKKKKNNEKRETTMQLQARIKALEDQLESLFVDRQPSQSAEEKQRDL